MLNGLLQKLNASILLGGVFTFCPALAEDAPAAAVSVASMSIPYAYEQNGAGVYNQIYDKMLEGYEGAVEVTFFPSNRLNRALRRRETDCVYIATENISAPAIEGEPEESLDFIGPVNTVSVVVYLNEEAPDIRDVEQLKGLKVASDVNLVTLINSVGIQEDFSLQSQIQMLEMLVAKRVDALVGFDFDLDFLSKKQGISHQLKKATIRLEQMNDGFACFENARTANFRQHLRDRLEYLTKSGWLDEVLKDYR